MKTLLSLLIFTFTVSNIFAQDFEFGIIGGANYNYNGDLTELNDISTVTDDVIHHAKDRKGFHAGVYTKLGDDLFVKTGLLYTQFENEFSETTTYTLKTKKIDIPLVVGKKVFGPVFIYAGADFQYILKEDFFETSLSENDVTYKDLTAGVHLGTGVTLGRFTFDVHWERGLTKDTASIFSDHIKNFSIDNRPNQMILSLQIALTD